MKNNFSSSIDASLSGRRVNEMAPEGSKKETSIIVDDVQDTDQKQEISSISTQTDKNGKHDKGLGKNIDGTYKQSNAGRKILSKEKRKVQVTLTLTPAAKNVLEEWASSKSRSVANYISEYVEENINSIMEYFSK